MNETFQLIRQGIHQLIPETADMELTADTTLEELPDWDSMVAVALQSFLEQELSVTISLDKFAEDTTLSELMDHIESLQSAAVN